MVLSNRFYLLKTCRFSYIPVYKNISLQKFFSLIFKCLIYILKRS